MSPAQTAPRPLASVVINNYNYGRFLAEAIESALSQTYLPLEVVVVDDGSTDNSVAVMDSYDGRIVDVRQENGGMASAINAGFHACHGDIVVFLDSDDLLLPNAVAEAAEQLSNPKVAKVHWPMREFDSTGKDTGVLVPKHQLPEGDVRDLVIEKGPMPGNGSPTSGNAWARWFLHSVLPMPEKELKQHADAYLNTLVCLAGQLRKISEPRGRYRVHGGNDYASEPMLERLRRNFQMYHYRCRLLSAHLRASGTIVDPVMWKKGDLSPYGHLVRRFSTMQMIALLVPAGAKFIIVDDGDYGEGKLIADRSSVRFPPTSPDGKGLPSGDEAISFLEHMRSDGAGFIVFVKPALHWLAKCDGLWQHLESRYPCEAATDLLVAFNLRETRIAR
ncbi:MAG: glycosyltransferase family A protein [Gemmatimonadaceae bacterium]